MVLDIEGFSGIRVGPDSLYGALERLARDGLIEAVEAEDRRRPYHLTERGRESRSINPRGGSPAGCAIRSATH